MMIIPKVFSILNIFACLFFIVRALVRPSERGADIPHTQDAYGAMFHKYAPPNHTSHSPEHKPLYSFQVIILAILATRMHLHLWHTDQHLRGSEALMIIPMSEVISYRVGSAGSNMESGVRNVGLD
jgi:hypothetical protein